MTFTEQLAAAWQKNDSLLCVGLDPDPAKFPAHLKGRDDAIFEFCAAIVDATADLACAPSSRRSPTSPPAAPKTSWKR
jgi:orotidine-5'-phosphate decarboxylase